MDEVERTRLVTSPAIRTSRERTALIPRTEEAVYMFICLKDERG